MRKTVIIQFAPQRTHEITVHADQPEMASFEARHWLDEQFVAQECEPLRSSGKVLTADKVMALAQAVPASKFTDDETWSQAFARSVRAALGRPLVTVDLHGNSINY